MPEKATKQFNAAVISTQFKDYSDTTTYHYDYDDEARTLPDLVSGEQIGISLGKIKGWLDRRHEVIVGELTEGTGKIPAELLPSYVDDVIDCYYNSEDGKMYTDAAKTVLLPYPEDAPEYTLLTTEPADWSTNYTDYYTYDESTKEYTPVPEGAGAPEWQAETYYRKNGDGDGEKGKIYQDLGGTPILFYRWTGMNFAETGTPAVTPDVDGADAAVFTLTTEEPANWSTNYTDYFTFDDTKPHNKYEAVPAGDTAPTWEADTYYEMTTAAADGAAGLVPAPPKEGYDQYQDLNNMFLRGDGTWSADPVITADKLVINCVVEE
jgi:hypothetical protein